MKPSVNQVEHAMDLIRRLSVCSKTNEKQDMIAEGLRSNPILHLVLKAALDPYQRYGFVDKLKLRTLAPPTTGGIGWPTIADMLHNLSDKMVTGAKAKEHVAATFDLLSASERELVKRVLLKDLKCGVGATLVNKVAPKLIPEFGVMLATPLEPHHLKKLQQQSRIFLQAKKNGDRCVVICDENPAAYSRKGHPHLNYEHIVAACMELCEQLGKRYVFDGEVINGDFYGTRAVKKKAGNNADSAQFHVFDMIALDQWKDGHTAPFGERRSTLKRAFHHVESDVLQRVASIKVQQNDITWEALEEARDDFIEAGEEGLIIRLDEPYNFKTRSSLFKFKKMQEGDFMILEIRDGKEGKKYADTAAKVLVDLGDGASCEVGIEGDMAFRAHLWKNRAKYAGMMCEVHYQEMTKNLEGVPKLQFGIMKKIRHDKS